MLFKLVTPQLQMFIWWVSWNIPKMFQLIPNLPFLSISNAHLMSELPTMLNIFNTSMCVLSPVNSYHVHSHVTELHSAICQCLLLCYCFSWCFCFFFWFYYSFLPFSVAANAKLWASAQTRSFVSVSGGGVGNSHECVAVGPWLKLGVTRSQAPHFSSDWKWTDGWMDFFAHA